MPNQKVMIVEDQRVVASDLRMTLMQLGYDVPAIASSGEEAIEKAKQVRPDLILMGVVLKGEMDGIETARHIYDAFDIPIIYLTAYADRSTLDRARETAPHGYIIKPYEDREIAIAIDLALYKHRLDQRLRQSEHKLSTILRCIDNAVIATDAGGFIAYLNPVASALTGYRAGEALGRHITEVVRIVLDEQPERPLKSPLAIVSESRSPFPVPEGSSLVNRAGGKTSVVGTIAPILDDREEIEGIVCVLYDNTGRRAAALALERSEKRYRALIENSSDVVALVDATGSIGYLSPSVRRVLGYEPEQVVGRNGAAYVHPDDRIRFGSFLAGMFASPGAIERGACRVKHGDGSWRWIEGAASNLLGDPAVEAIVVNFRDITRQREAEEELDRRVRDRTEQVEAANRELESFSYSVAHDLRAPLRAINGFSGALVEDYAAQLDPQAKNYLEIIRANTHAMGQLIDDLLAFSRLSRKSVEKRLIDMASLVESVVAEVMAAEKGRRVQVVLKPVPPAEGDLPLLRQALFNLLSNAFKFTRDQQDPVVEVGSLPHDGCNAYYVRDNGVGFEMQYAQKLFGVFQRLHPQDEFEGSGVGLAIVHRIITRHGGCVWAEGEVGQGATFYFTLPEAGG